MTTETVLEVDDLRMHLVFDRSVAKVVDGISLNVRQGEVLGVVGESGAGKSMLALSLIGHPPKPYGKIVGGTVKYRGIDMLDRAQSRAVVGDRIGIIFENPGASLDPCYRIGFQIAETIVTHEGITMEAARERAYELLNLVGIPDPQLAYLAYPHQFSGGMQQRVMIAISLACNPDLLIADNPTSSLDVTVQAQILRLVGDLRERLGLTVVWITHDLGVVAKLCDRVAIMYAGKIVEQGSVRRVLKDSFHPYTRALLGVSPKIRDQGRLVPIAGNQPSPFQLGDGCRFATRCPEVRDDCRTGEIIMEPIEDGHQARCVLAKERR